MPDARRYLLYKLNSPDLHRTSRVRPDLAGWRWCGWDRTGRRACRRDQADSIHDPQITAWPADTGTRTVCAVTALASLKFSEALPRRLATVTLTARWPIWAPPRSSSPSPPASASWTARRADKLSCSFDSALPDRNCTLDLRPYGAFRPWADEMSPIATE